VGEVEEILAGLERENVDIDSLGKEVKRAVELIQVCREKLEQTDREVRGLVAGLQTDAKAEASADGDSASEDSANEDSANEDLPF